MPRRLTVPIIVGLCFLLFIFVTNIITYRDENNIVIKEGVVGQIRNLHPFYASENDLDNQLIPLLYRSLVRYNKSGQLENDLADSIVSSADGLEYIVTIKQNQQWSDGKKIKASDVFFTASRDTNLKKFELQKLDDYTLKFKLASSFAPFMELLTIPIAPEHINPSKLILNPVSSGPYKVSKVDLAPAFVESLELTPIAKTGKIEKIIFKFYKTDEELKAAIDLGEINIHHEIIPNSILDFKYQTLSGTKTILFLNTEEGKYFSDLQKRMSVAKSIDFKSLVDIVFHDTVTISTNIYDGTDYQDSSIKMPSFESNSDILSGDVVLAVQDDIKLVELAKALQAQLLIKGLGSKIVTFKLEHMQDEILKPNLYDLLLTTVQSGHDPDRYAFWHSSQTQEKGLNISNFKNIRMDKALEKARTTLNEEERRTHYSVFQSIIAEEVPAVVLFSPRVYYYFNWELEGLDFSATTTEKEKYRYALFN